MKPCKNTQQNMSNLNPPCKIISTFKTSVNSHGDGKHSIGNIVNIVVTMYGVKGVPDFFGGITS